MRDEDQYEIESEPARRLVRLRMTGILNEQIINRIMADFRREALRLEALGCPSGSLRTLVDLRQMDIQTKEVASRIEEAVFANNHLSERVAVLLPPSALHGLQIKRISPPENHGFFKSEDEAESWLSID